MKNLSSNHIFLSCVIGEHTRVDLLVLVFKQAVPGQTAMYSL